GRFLPSAGLVIGGVAFSLMGSARVSRVGFGVAPKRSFSGPARWNACEAVKKSSRSRERARQHAERMRYPEHAICHSISATRWRDSAFDRHPFIPRTRIGDSLHDAHVSNTVLEGRVRTHAALGFYRREKILFHAPFAFQFRR